MSETFSTTKLTAEGWEPWTPHDPRRTGTTRMREAGVDQFTVKKILNHSFKSETDIYDQYSMDKEKKEAMLKWERSLRGILGEEQKVVVDFPGGAS